ncbi:hypothetical protein GGR51DRAFT_350084 [Nemania sp. FL0031]|nr:hypothetical protein GGR51DRAFT_350084 [Nemania sp. FL0031]
MSAKECPETITITSQADIRNASLAACKSDQGFKQLTITTDAEGLSFTNFTGGFNISVVSSPQLQILDFPDLTALQHLHVVDAPALTQIQLSELRASAETLVYPVTYTFTPSISIDNALQFGGLSLPALTALNDLEVAHVPRLQLVSGGLSKITTADSIVSDNVLAYPGLASVGTLQLTGYDGCSYYLPNLSSIVDFSFTNAVNSRLWTAATLKVDGSFVLDTAPYRRAANESTDELIPSRSSSVGNNIDVSNITAVAVNATIRSNADTHIDISKLTTVGGAFSVTNNTNCSIDVTKLTQAGTLSIMDNTDSVIPQLFNLARAESIHLRGNIDTSSGPNILPSLTFVSGTVTIEAWNADFNCSRLVSQQQQGLINNLQCNGTSNGTASTASTPLSPSSSTSALSQSASSGLSSGAWAGIGVGIGLVVIGLLGGAAWLFLYFRRRFAALEASARQTQPPQGPPSSAPDSERPINGDYYQHQHPNHPEIDSTTLSESDYRSSRREVYEVDNSGMKVEKPAYPIDVSYEMFVPPAELPVSQPRRVN